MFKLSAIFVLALALCVVADPLRQRPLRRRILARQEALPTPAPTGYAPAGITPEIPFKLPTETEKPVVETHLPDEVYGPPEFDTQQPDEVFGPPDTEVVHQPDEVYGPPETEVVHQPDEVYGPPETEATEQSDIEPEIVEEFEAEEETENVAEDLDNVEDVIVAENPARLVYQRRQPARLTKTKIVRPTNFFHTARFQKFSKK